MKVSHVCSRTWCSRFRVSRLTLRGARRREDGDEACLARRGKMAQASPCTGQLALLLAKHHLELSNSASFESLPSTTSPTLGAVSMAPGHFVRVNLGSRRVTHHQPFCRILRGK